MVGLTLFYCNNEQNRSNFGQVLKIGGNAFERSSLNDLFLNENEKRISLFAVA
jgi:hypothetical protein